MTAKKLPNGRPALPALVIPLLLWCTMVLSALPASDVKAAGTSRSAAFRASPAAPGTYLIPNVPYYGQVDTEDCETAALQMALAHEGIHVSQARLLGAERISLKPPILNAQGRVVRWGDPYDSFVGQPDSRSVSMYNSRNAGYGTYASNIARVARLFGGKVLWSGTGLTRAALVDAVRRGHPVIAWVGDRDGRMLRAPLDTWTAWDGVRVPYPAPSSGVYEHTVVVAGVTPTGPYIDDPLDGARSGRVLNPIVGPGPVSWASFRAGFSTFGGMAVILR